MAVRALRRSGALPLHVLAAPNVYRTRVLDLALPARQEGHTPLRITGTVQDLRGSAWKPLGSAGVAFYYRLLPKGNWVYAGSAKTISTFGTFSWRPRLTAITAPSSPSRAISFPRAR